MKAVAKICRDDPCFGIDVSNFTIEKIEEIILNWEDYFGNAEKYCNIFIVKNIEFFKKDSFYCLNFETPYSERVSMVMGGSHDYGEFNVPAFLFEGVDDGCFDIVIEPETEAERCFLKDLTDNCTILNEFGDCYVKQNNGYGITECIILIEK
jgi:hypothetical protein